MRMDDFKLDTKVMLLANMTRKSESKTWGGHNRSMTNGASEIGQCQRKLVFDKHGVDPDSGFVQDYGAAERGNAMEDWVVDGLKHSLPDDIELIWATDEGQKTLVDKLAYQSATPDGLFVSKDLFPLNVDGTDVLTNCVYNEIKSIDPRPYDFLREPKQVHVLQCQQGMDLVRRLTEYEPTHAVITYVNASFYSQIKTFIIPFDQKIADGLRARSLEVFNWYSPDKLPMPEGKLMGGDECQYCPWRRQCNGDLVAALPTQEKSNYEQAIEQRLFDLAVKRHALVSVKKDKEQEIRDVEQEIKEVLQEADTKKVKADWGSVSVYAQKSPPRYDKEKFEKAGLRPSDFQTEGEYTPRLSVTLRT